MAAKDTELRGAFLQARKRMTCFEQEVADEPWKLNHLEVERLHAFEDTLQFGVAIFDLFISIDERIRLAFFSGALKHDPEHTAQVRGLFEWWLRPCKAVEKELLKFEQS
ncbi:MAG: hypothetical protein HYR85_25020, partial [Planctomycetes bacterium]|nr:hypothetical protein [Planctomycetota bacterium]